MTPLMPEAADELQDYAIKVLQKSSALANSQHPVTINTLRELLRIINSYYSNLIEGHNTHPFDIIRAMQKDYDSEPAKRNLQIESVAHITVQKNIEKKLRDEPDINIAGREFLYAIHREFYRQLPEEFRIMKNPETGRESMVTPGELREEHVKVGYHQPPESGSLKAHLDRFGEFYVPEKHYGALKLVAAAAAHHRLMWIHPFLDGNGRVARLFTEAYFYRIPIHGSGLWSVSRGLARRNADYKSALSRADMLRRNDLDGRGNLSNEGLINFCRLFLEICLDQVEHMESLLRLDELLQRIKGYVELRGTGMVRGPAGEKTLRKEASGILREVLVRGETTRGSAIASSGLKERTGRDLLGQLIEEGLLISDTPKGNVRLGFPIHAAGWFFPDLYPIMSR